MNDDRYKNAKIYQIVNSVDKQTYVGSTIQTLSSRFNRHKSCARKHTTPICQHIRNVGEQHFSITLIETFPCNNRFELEERERYWILTLKPTLNRYLPNSCPPSFLIPTSHVREPVAVVNAPNYKNAKIFRIHHQSNDKTFVGSTTFDLQKVLCEYYDTRKVEPSQTPTLHNYMVECGRAFYITLIQDYPCSSKDELLAREQFWIRKLKPELNEPIPDDAEPLPVNPRDQKDIKKSQYKNSKIFKIGNTVDDKIFVGSTHDNPMSCLCDHIVQSHDPMLQLHRHIKKHGFKQFNIVILEKFPCSSLSELQAVEAMWIKKLKPFLNYPVDPYWKYMQKLEKERKYKS